MNNALRQVITTFGIVLYVSCSPSDPYVHQRIPIRIQKSITIEIHSLAENGTHTVGIQCSSLIWSALINAQQSITVQIKSAEQSYTRVFEIEPGLKGTFCDQIPDLHYLFSISGKGNAVVEITFRNVPIDLPGADIVICKTPAQTTL